MSKKTFYQMLLRGEYKYFDGPCTIYSKDIYQRPPTEDEINAFVQRCGSNAKFDMYDVNLEKEYKVKIVELDLIVDN